MYFLYADASGTPDVRDQSREYVVVGLALPEHAWSSLDASVQALRKKYGLIQTSAELHAKDFCVSIQEQLDVPDFESLSWNDRRAAVLEVRKKKLQRYTGEKRESKAKHFRNTEPYVHLTRPERSELLQDALDLVGASRDVRLFGEAIRKQDAKEDVVVQAFEQLVSRFDTFLERLNVRARRARRLLERSTRKASVDVDGSAYEHKGLLIMDEEPVRETSYRAMLNRFRDSGHPWGNLKHVVEAPFFVDSALSPATQLADICAYAVRRYLEHQGAAHPHEEANFRRIFSRFDRAAKLHGLRHYCVRGTCSCLVCVERGHAEPSPAG